MSAHRPKSPLSEHRYAAVITLDPAAVADCGIAVRLTAGLDGNTPRGKLAEPDWVFEGSVWNSLMHDELAGFLYSNVARGQTVLLGVEDAMFGARTTARHLGRAIGCLEGVLGDLGLWSNGESRYIFPGNWRRVSLPLHPKPDGRDAWKAAAVDAVFTLYGMQCGDNQAEAVLMNDYVMYARQDWWMHKQARKAAA